MTTEITTLGIGVDTSQVTNAATALDKLAGAGKRAETASSQLEKAFAEVIRETKSISAGVQELVRMTAAANATASATAKIAPELSKVTTAGKGAAEAINATATGATKIGSTGGAATALAVGLDRVRVSGAGAADSTAKVGTAALELGRSAETARASSSALQGSLLSLRAAFGGLSAAVIAREIVQAADAMANLSARVALVTTSVNDFDRAQRQIIAISQQTRTGLTETADLFTSLSRATESLGASQDDVLGVTRTINQALTVSGTSAAGAAAALVQLGQGFASGTLRGEELNSVLEQAPRLARAIADGLGVTVGQLRQLGQDGKLTAEQVFGAIQKGGQAINDEFAKMPVTVSQATTVAGNALTVLVGAMDSASGASGSLAGAISAASQEILIFADEIKRGAKGAEDIGVLASAFLNVSEVVQVLYVNTKFVFQGIGREIGAVTAQLMALGRLDFAGFSAISEAVKEDAKKARVEVDRLTAEILARKPNAQELLRRTEDRGFDPLRKSQVGTTPSADAKGSGSKIDPYEAQLKSLRERLVLLGKEGELEKINAQIADGRFGKLTEQRRLTLQYAAIQIDQYNQEQERLKEVERARDAATASLTRSSVAALDALDASRESNQALADEIELIGLGARERAAVENERLQSIINAKEQLIAERELAGIGEERNQVLQQEIDLLKERQQLNTSKAIKEADRSIKDTGNKTTETLSASIEEGILTGFRSGKSLSQIFLDELRAQFAKTILRPVIQPVLAGAQEAAGNLFLKIAGAAAGLFGGGLSIDTAGIGITNASTGSLASLGLGAGRANGGPVYPNTLHPVNERGPELLTVGNKQFLMMGAQGGKVTPNSELGGMGGGINVINQTSGRVDRATWVPMPDGERALLLQEAADLAERRITNSLSNPNSRMSRSQQRNFKTERNR